MGAREGTEPEHNPLTRSLSARARAKGYADGRMELVAAALACTGEADFRRRIREQRGLHAELQR